jgi:tRNA dimethylallyltransferase
MKKPLIILTGPTAVGKTELSIRLARLVNGEIISADSMQVYKHMDIGSAKIRQEEMEGVPHHLVDVFEPDEEFHVVRFQECARRCMEEIYGRKRIPILVGGTGFYIQAVLYDIDFTENGGDDSYRKGLEALAKEKGNEVLHQMLREVDAPSAEQIHANNVKRVIRALEYYHETGEPISRHNEQERQKESPYNFAYFVLNDRRDRLYAKIDARVDGMLQDGLVEEVRALKEKGYTKDMVSMQGLGYKEILSYLDGECTLEEAVYILKRDTRHFAKRQLTWFRREREVCWLDKEAFAYDHEKILERMAEVLREKEILPV